MLERLRALLRMKEWKGGRGERYRMESLRLFKTPTGGERKSRRQEMRALLALAGIGFSSVLCAGQATGPVLTQSVGGSSQGSGTSEASLASVGGLTDLPIAAGQTVH
ncbi:MAG TPA: hypothetical protein VGR64_01725, partial [Terracidiphilus sp.]|nr:hypothetical protein [Terracidiphilus sp.]